MEKRKDSTFYSWWANFWLLLLIATAVINWRVCLRFLPLIFIVFIGYSFFMMISTKPNIQTDKESSATKDKAETSE